MSNRLTQRVRNLVPVELTQAYDGLRAAAALDGAGGPGRSDEWADEVLLEVAALLAGRPPADAEQRGFVAARVAAMEEVTASLRERHESWSAALDELDSLDPSTIDLPAMPSAPPADRLGVRLLVLVLLPPLLAWDLLCAAGRGAVRLAAGATHLAGAAVIGAARMSIRLRRRVVASVREARHRVVAIRLRVRLAVRRARRRAGATRRAG